jgi:polysaccharide transporter, PST family
MSLRHAASRNIVWSAVERWGGQLLAVIVFTLLARLLDKPLFGMMALANIYVAFVQIFVTQGMGLALIQTPRLERSHLDTAFWLNVGIALTLAGMTVLFRNEAAAFLGSADVAPVLAWLALALPLSALSVVPSAILQRELKFKPLAARSLASAAVSGVVGIGAALLGFGIWSLVLQQLIAACASTILLWSSVDWRPGFHQNRRALGDLLPFSASVMGNDLLWLTSQRVDQAFIGRGLGVEALGGYFVSLRVVNIGLDAVAAPTQAVAMPLFSGIQDQPERLGRIFLRSTSLVCSIAFPAFVGLLLVAPRLLPAVFGAKWNDAVLPLQILCVAGCVRAAQTFVHPSMLALGKPGIYTAIFTLNALVSALTCFLAARYSVAAVAYAVLISGVITGFVNCALLARLLRFHLTALGSNLLPILSACGLVVLALVTLDSTLSEHLGGLAIIAVQAAVATSVYIGSMMVLAPAIWAEFRVITKLITGKSSGVSLSSSA